MKISCGEGEGEGVSFGVTFEIGAGEVEGRLALWRNDVQEFLPCGQNVKHERNDRKDGVFCYSSDYEKKRMYDLYVRKGNCLSLPKCCNWVVASSPVDA